MAKPTHRLTATNRDNDQETHEIGAGWAPKTERQVEAGLTNVQFGTSRDIKPGTMRITFETGAGEKVSVDPSKFWFNLWGPRLDDDF